ncbi:MAG: hypothetical protein M3Q69_08365 [Acidobacteriota bacterium]|nr:hypothetical protein [Acidobacteriota bacterium]
MPTAPWINVEPSTTPAAMLGELPKTQGSVVYPIPGTVVPPGATGIMVFAWYAVAGTIARPGWWHFAVNTGSGVANWFSLMIAGAGAQPVTLCNSQEFWLPMPVDGALTVTFFHGELLPSACASSVEIHGYSL